jgi:hypothetical protein
MSYKKNENIIPFNCLSVATNRLYIRSGNGKLGHIESHIYEVLPKRKGNRQRPFATA